jgi:hypothetical protein
MAYVDLVKVEESYGTAMILALAFVYLFKSS